MKYPISKEYFPFSHIAPPIRNAGVAGFLGSLLRAPRWVFHDKELFAERKYIKSFDGEDVGLLVLSPRGACGKLPCLVYYHGGGFVFGASGPHYRMAREYALRTPCKVVFVQYRLAPKYKFPIPAEDCYNALLWVYHNSSELGINRIAVGGDSAGGALAASVVQMARDRGIGVPDFQLLVYPVTDRRMNTESNKLFTDTPMWNSRLSVMMWDAYFDSRTKTNIAYASPMEAESFKHLSPAYVEVAEFDCLRDEGINYAKALSSAGIAVKLNMIPATMHGFDVVYKAATTREAVSKRIEYMKEQFYC